jgi:hypothetical protein
MQSYLAEYISTQSEHPLVQGEVYDTMQENWFKSTMLFVYFLSMVFGALGTWTGL